MLSRKNVWEGGGGPDVHTHRHTSKYVLDKTWLD